MAPLSTDVVACPDCDLLQRIPALSPGGTACCPRCGRKLATCKPGSLERTTALAVAAAIAFLITNVEPLMKLSVAGREASTTIAGGAWQMWEHGEKITALLIAFFAVIAPALEIGFLLTILLSVRRPPAPRWIGTLLRWVEIAGSWSMVEVMMLGILVSLVKIAALAKVIPGAGIFAAGGLILLLAAMSSSFDPREAWSRVRWVNGEWQQGALPAGGADAAEAGR
jgi:paraquat-inducible protein A